MFSSKNLIEESKLEETIRRIVSESFTMLDFIRIFKKRLSQKTGSCSLRDPSSLAEKGDTLSQLANQTDLVPILTNLVRFRFPLFVIRKANPRITDEPLTRIKEI